MRPASGGWASTTPRRRRSSTSTWRPTRSTSRSRRSTSPAASHGSSRRSRATSCGARARSWPSRAAGRGGSSRPGRTAGSSLRRPLAARRALPLHVRDVALGARPCSAPLGAVKRTSRWLPSQNGRRRDLPQRQSATVSRPWSIALPSWSRMRNGPRTSSGPSRYGVIVTSSSIAGQPYPQRGPLRRRGRRARSRGRARAARAARRRRAPRPAPAGSRGPRARRGRR